MLRHSQTAKRCGQICMTRVLFHMETKQPYKQFGQMSPPLNVEYCLNDRMPVHDQAYPLYPPNDFGMAAKEQSQKPNRRNKKTTFGIIFSNSLDNNAPHIVHNNTIKLISMTCHDNRGFPLASCRVCPAACLLLVRNSISNQISPND